MRARSVGLGAPPSGRRFCRFCNGRLQGRWLRTITSVNLCTSRFNRHQAIVGSTLCGPIHGGSPAMLAFGKILLLGGGLFCQRLEPARDTWRLLIRRPQMFGEKRDPGVVAEILVAEILPVPGAKLDKYHRPERTNHSADDRARRGPVFQIRIIRRIIRHSSGLHLPARLCQREAPPHSHSSISIFPSIAFRITLSVKNSLLVLSLTKSSWTYCYEQDRH